MTLGTWPGHHGSGIRRGERKSRDAGMIMLIDLSFLEVALRCAALRCVALRCVALCCVAGLNLRDQLIGSYDLQ